MHIDSENSLINIGIYGERNGLIKSPRDTWLCFDRLSFCWDKFLTGNYFVRSVPRLLFIVWSRYGKKQRSGKPIKIYEFPAMTSIHDDIVRVDVSPWIYRLWCRISHGDTAKGRFGASEADLFVTQK